MVRVSLSAAAMAAALAITGFGFAGSARADDASYTLSIKDHAFQPTTLEIPAGAKVKLLVKNLDATAEEFESYDLNREKIVAGNGEITVLLGPLEPGTYKFFGDFHQDSANGTIVVK
ncbi:MAG TPA: cupredoxin domain-containing protein [Parvibaculum sp.]